MTLPDLMDAYITRLLNDPQAPPPPGMDEEASRLVRELVRAGSIETERALRDRVWLRAAAMAGRANGFRQEDRFPLIGTLQGDEPMAQWAMVFPTRVMRRRGRSMNAAWVFAMAAVVTLVFGVLALAQASNRSNLPQGQYGAQPGMVLQGTEEAAETATPIATGTPIPIQPAVIQSSLTPQIAGYVVQEGDKLRTVLDLFGLDRSAVGSITALNPDLEFSGLDDTLPAGETILLLLPVDEGCVDFSPVSTALPPTAIAPVEETPTGRTLIVTATPIPVPPAVVRPCDAVEQARHSLLEALPTVLPVTIVPPSAEALGYAGIEEVEIQSGETLLDIAVRYDVTLAVLATLNPELDWTGCDFNRASGGPNCGSGIRAGTVIRVPVHGATQG